jgi:nitronate monooxygenase
VTDVDEARHAAGVGADALIVQGIEAGGHRASFVDREGAGDYGLLALLQLVGAHVDLPLVASGAIASGGALAAVLCAGAQAAQIGTAFMRCPEAGTAPAHREALAADTPTRLTRAFTGRQARGIVNRFLREHSEDAPPAYPEIHHVTAPLRAAGRAAGDADMINLWAGQAHELAREAPAAEVVAALAFEAREHLDAARRALDRA